MRAQTFSLTFFFLMKQEIDEKILSLGEFVAEITSVDAQESYLGGVLVLVTGFMSGKDGVRQKFTQCFFLAPQEKGYFVLNDAFRYVDENGSRGFFGDVESPVNPDDGTMLHYLDEIILVYCGGLL